REPGQDLGQGPGRRSRSLCQGLLDKPAHRALQQLERQRYIPPGIDILLVETECYPIPGPRKNRRLSIRRPLDLPDPPAMLRMGSRDRFLEVGARGVRGLAVLDSHVELGHHSHLDPIWYLTDVQKQDKFFRIHVSRSERKRHDPTPSLESHHKGSEGVHHVAP